MLRKAIIIGLFSVSTSVAMADACSFNLDSTDKMTFSTKEIVVPATCKNFIINLTHSGKQPKLLMGHNVVISKKADMMKIVSASAKAGAKKDYIVHGDPKIIAHSKLIGGGEKTSVSVAVEKIKNGEFVYFCSYPGHAGSMKGKLIVK